METFILIHTLKRGFFDFCKRKNFSTFYKSLLFNYLHVLFARVRSIFAKGCFLKPQKKFLRKVLEIGKTVL
uniref:Uncharacterized protein n=1 Tax=virus sp. ct5rm7 TaxID=2827298 RepID=A0A8S5RFZ9_9VIRU|nr:MAG TPA: hypothetical protein [virus sp. ct5rm7]